MARARGVPGAWQPVGPGGALFFASSAGGVYAGATGSPFTEETAPVAISPYGHAKLRAEAAVDAFATRTGVPLLVGRLSNLYGPGQDLAKPQGLISQLCRAQLTRQPLSIYVSLDTRRDYLYVDDAAAMVVAGLDAVSSAGAPPQGARQRALAPRSARSRRPAPHHPAPAAGGARLVGQRAATRPATSASRSTAWPPVAVHARTPLMAGMAATLPRGRPDAHGARRADAMPCRRCCGLTESKEADATSGHRRRRLHRQPLRPHRARRRLGRVGPRRLVVLDKLTYAGNLANLDAGARRRAAALRPGRHPRPRGSSTS